MAYKPLSQTVSDDAVFANPSSEAVFELAKEKADVDLQNLSITGTNGQVLTLGASGPYWEDVAASGGGGSAEYPPQGGNAGKFLQTNGSEVSWQAVTGFEPTVSLTSDRVVISNASGKLAVSSVTPTTLGYLDVSSSVTGLLSEKANIALSNLSGTTAINSTLLFQSDDTLDIGASADFRPANVYVTQSLQVPRIHPVDGVGSAYHNLTIRGGDGITGNHDGGDVTIRGGNKNGSGADGEILLQTSGQTRLTIGATGNIQASGITASRALVTDASSNITASSITATQLGYLSSASGDIQNQLNGKEPTLTKGNLTEATSSVLTISGGTGSVIGSGTTIQVKQASGSQSGFLASSDFTTFSNKQNAITGGASSITTSDLTASRALVSDASGKVSASSVTSATLAFLDATSSVQTQINGKQNTGNYITALTGDVTASGPGSVAATVAQVAGTSVSAATANTTDATVTTLQTIGTSSNSILGIEVKISARRTGGASGTTNDSAYYVLHGMAKNNAGTVTISTVVSSEFEDQSGWDADLVASGTNILVRVTGAAGNNISWRASTQTISI